MRAVNIKEVAGYGVDLMTTEQIMLALPRVDLPDGLRSALDAACRNLHRYEDIEGYNGENFSFRSRFGEKLLIELSKDINNPLVSDVARYAYEAESEIVRLRKQVALLQGGN